MRKSTVESLEAFLKRQDATALCAVLLELMEAHEEVRHRLERLQLADQPGKLAAGFKKALAAWRRSTRFHGYRESRDYAQMLQAWLEQVARELAPKDPPAALDLFERFIESDTVWFEHADDSDGAIGDAVRSACRHWLQAAALCETPAGIWPERLLSLFLADQYGAREELLRHANLLLDETALRALVARSESRMAASLADDCPDSHPSRDAYRSSAALSLLSEALGDPDVEVRSVLRRSPDPNPMQRQSLAQAYLDVGRAADALAWLQGSWAHMEYSRQHLLAQAFEQLGRFEESLPIRKQTFEQSPSLDTLQRWLQHLPTAARSEALAHARHVALAHVEPVAGAVVLLELGDAQAAESRLMADPAAIDGRNYPELVPLAKALRAHQRGRGETVIYRALLRGILERGYAKAYGHGARYLARLREIAAEGIELTPLEAHDSFEGEIRLRHGRKSAFWAHANGKRASSFEDEVDG